MAGIHSQLHCGGACRRGCHNVYTVVVKYRAHWRIFSHAYDFWFIIITSDTVVHPARNITRGCQPAEDIFGDGQERGST